ncbi:hypothetical protein [Chondrinema litorale]|uniref:hypothetical protein n=1 Tax=Chondrinema litorale TaxID=2994555 RepID=UPI002542CCBE|nr:hypothetical protein [Chondrinema litorale]UZR94272.1 hypothetical protein OQ292_00385 [Chondrinema litorale]
MNNSKIDLRKIRDFGTNVSISIEFIKENFTPFIKSLIFIAGPFILISSILSGIFMSEFMSMMLNPSANVVAGPFSMLPENFSTYMLNGVLIQFIGLIAVIAVTYRYLLLYPEHGKNISFELVWKYVKRDFISVALGQLLTIAIIGGSVFVLFALITAIGFFNGGWFVGMLAFFAFIYLLIPCSLIFIIQMTENVNPIVAIQRAFSLIRGNWLSTFGILMVSSIIMYFINMIFYIPMYIVNFVTTINTLDPLAASNNEYLSLITLISTVLGTIGLFFAIPVFYLSLGFQYFSIVEKKEHIGLIERIELIGTKEDEYYL